MEDEFSVEGLRKLINGEIGREIVFLQSIDSTNVLAMELAEKGSPHGAVIIAESQTKGKGRLGRRWLSPPKGNIYMSIILRPEVKAGDAVILTIMTAVACALAIRNVTGLEVKIKWPNDLIVRDKKLGGILIEARSELERIIFAVIGIGINVNMEAGDFPPDIQHIATSIKEESGKPQSRSFIVAEILKEIGRWYEVLIRAGKVPLLDEWRRLSYRDCRRYR